jgi:hypothetical protein
MQMDTRFSYSTLKQGLQGWSIEVILIPLTNVTMESKMYSGHWGAQEEKVSSFTSEKQQAPTNHR